MAARNGVVSGGESGVLELNSLANPSGGRQVPGAESGVTKSNSPLNPCRGSPRQDLGAQSGVPELNSHLNPTRGHPRPDPQSVTLVEPKNCAQQEIQNVLWIEGNPEHQIALKEWNRKKSYLSSKVGDKEKRSSDLMKQIVNLVWFFIVFQGVVLTVVSQLKASNKPLCGIVWVPALLSGAAAVVTIIGIWINFSTLQEVEVSIFCEKMAQREVAGRVTRLLAEGRNFSFSRHAAQGGIRKPSSWISVSRIWILLLLFAFSGLFIMSYVVILCDSLVIHKWNQHL